MRYYEGDIIELLRIDVDKGSEGRVRSDWGYIPSVGDRFIVKHVFDTFLTLHISENREANISIYEVCLYKTYHIDYLPQHIDHR